MISNKLLKNYKKPKKWQTFRKNRRWVKNKENRIHIRGEFRESLGIIFSVPFSLKGSSKCTNHVNVHKFYADAVKYINPACSLDDPFPFGIF